MILGLTLFGVFVALTRTFGWGASHRRRVLKHISMISRWWCRCLGDAPDDDDDDADDDGGAVHSVECPASSATPPPHNSQTPHTHSSGSPGRRSPSAWRRRSSRCLREPHCGYLVASWGDGRYEESGGRSGEDAGGHFEASGRQWCGFS